MEEQRLPGLGAHDVELMSAPDGERLLAVANQGDGADCATGSLDVYALRSSRWALVQRLRAGCATYASSFVLAGMLHVALAVERTGADESDQQSYRAESPVYVYKARGSVAGRSGLELQTDPWTDLGTAVASLD